MKVTFLSLVLIFLSFSSCKKSKPVVFSGQLLLTRKTPVPLSNKQIEIFQLGGNAILMGSSGSSASTITDGNGRFSMTFVPGTAYFSALTGENKGPLTLAGMNDGYPNFLRRFFPEPGYDATIPIFVGKQIDTLIVKVICFKKIISSDTLALKVQTLDSGLNKRYVGITADSATTFTLDTIYNALFTDYDCIRKNFSDYSLEFGRQRIHPVLNTLYFSWQNLYSMGLPAEDETKREISFNYMQ